MTAWTDLVKKVYNENKHKPGYKLGNAMKDAKKVYKTSSKKHTATPYPVKGGSCGVAPVNPFPETAASVAGGGKSRRRRGGKKSNRTKKCSM